MDNSKKNCIHFSIPDDGTAHSDIQHEVQVKIQGLQEKTLPKNEL